MLQNNYLLLYPKLLLLVPIYYIIKWIFIKKLKAKIFSNIALLQRVSTKEFDINKILEFFIVFLISLSLAMPVSKSSKEIKKELGYSIVIALDASASMAEDNRFKLAKSAAINFIKKRKNDEIGLIVFANYALIASPLTYDKKSLITMLNYIKLGVAGDRETALNEAIYKALSLLKGKKEKILIILSDGIDTVHNISNDIIFKDIKEKNLKIFAIALGKKGDVDEAFLKDISSNGKFFYTIDPKKLDYIYNKIDSLEKSKIVTNRVVEYIYYYKYTLLLALIILLIYLYLGGISKIYAAIIALVIILFLILPTPKDSKVANLKKNKDIIIALDISPSMRANDIYPNRLEYAKAKIINYLKSVKNKRVALFAFSNKAYLISPFTKDYKRLIYQIKHLNPDISTQKEPNFLNLLKAIKKVNNKDNKVIIYSAGGEIKSFQDIIKYANKNSIDIKVIPIGTKKGGVVKINGNYITNNNGDIKIFRLNSKLEQLK